MFNPIIVMCPNLVKCKILNDRGSFTRRRLLELLNEISMFDNPEYGQNLRLISEKLNISRQLLNHYMKRLITAKLIERIQSWPFAVYRLTEKAKLVKSSLVQSDKTLKTEWRYHNLVLKSKVKSWGAWQFGKITPMCGGWGYQDIMVNNTTVRMQTSGWIRITAPELIGENLEELQARAAAGVQETLRILIDKYNMETSTIVLSRKGSKELLRSGDLARFLGRVKTEDIYVDKSGDEDNLEEPEDSHKIEDLLSMPETMRRLDTRLVPVIEALTRQIELHLEVQRNALKTSSEIRDGINEFRNEIRAFREERRAVGHGDVPRVLMGSCTSASPSMPKADDYVQGAPRIEVRFLRPHGKLECAGAMIGPFSQGASIYLPDELALWLIDSEIAERAV